MEKFERLRHAREQAGFRSAAVAADALGVKRPTYTHHENGTRDFDEKQAEFYARRLNVRLEWLLFGRGMMVRSLVDSFDPDEADEGSADAAFGVNSIALPAGAIPEADVRVGLGGGGISSVAQVLTIGGEAFAAEGLRDWWRVPEHFTRGRFRVPTSRIRCFESMGDSMAPTILDGDMVFADVGHQIPSPAGIYVLADPLGGVVCKRVEIVSVHNEDPVRIRVSSDNPNHPPDERTLGEIAIVGRYLGRLTTG